MRINWVIAGGYQIDPTVDLEKFKGIGSLWGSWTTWRSCGTDNVVCSDFAKSRDLIARAFQSVCNFYIPSGYYQDLGRPLGCKLYDGQFAQEVDNLDDIVAMHLASSQSDIILLLGFDFGLPVQVTDKFQAHKIKNYHGLMRGIISGSTAQWVAVDADVMDKAYQNLDNLTTDRLETILASLG